MDINISDRFTARDVVDANSNYTPTGIIRLYDKDGNLIVEKHNMIVKTGRDLIYKCFLVNAFSSTFLAGNDVNFELQQRYSLSVNFSYIQEGSVKTTEGLTYEMIKNAESTTQNNDSVIVRKTLVPTVELDANELTLKLTASFNGSDTFTKFNQIYLTYGVENNNTIPQQLFSRVALDPVFIGADGTYTLKYTIYF